MPKDNLKLPTGQTVPLIYGAKHPGKGTTYLNAVRMTSVDEKSLMAVEYHAMENSYAQELAVQVMFEVPDFDAVLSPPSSRPQDAKTYRDAVLRDQSVPDLTFDFRRRGKIKVGHNDTNLEQAIGEMIYTSSGIESDIKSLLIIDESVASGKTIAAVLHHMRKAGLPKDCVVTVVAWARIDP